MTTIKSYTDIEQSRKLAEILPLESADMEYLSLKETNATIGSIPFVKDASEVENSAYDAIYARIPCWSLAALLNILNSIDGWYPGIDAQVGEDNLWQICMFSYETGSDISTAAINKELVDTCYEVILKLKEKNLL